MGTLATEADEKPSRWSGNFLVMPLKSLGRASATFGRASEYERVLSLSD